MEKQWAKNRMFHQNIFLFFNGLMEYPKIHFSVGPDLSGWVFHGAIPFVLALLSAIFWTSCQKVINVNLVESAPQLVIEGVVTDIPGSYIVKISKSGSYFNQPVLPPVSKAVVVITDNVGTIDTLREVASGVYLTSKIKGVPGRSYFLTVLSENIRYTASSTMYSHVEIDSLKLMKGQSQGIGLGGHGQNEERIEVHCFFRDPLEKNFYRIKGYLNDSIGAANYRLYDDQYTNGSETDLQVRRAVLNDTILVELISLDKSTYEYYRTLSDLLHTNPIFGSTPANPTSNLSNGALGYFGACATSSKMIIVTDSLFNSAK